MYGLYPYQSSMIRLENLGDPSANWDIVETIGKGTYGKVYKVINKKDGSQAAVKVLDPINVSLIKTHYLLNLRTQSCCDALLMADLRWYIIVTSIPQSSFFFLGSAHFRCFSASTQLIHNAELPLQLMKASEPRGALVEISKLHKHNSHLSRQKF